MIWRGGNWHYVEGCDCPRCLDARPVSVPRHTGPGVPAPCGCLWESGTVYPCVEHATPHSLHQTPAPFCPMCDDALDEARETLAEFEDEELSE